MPEDEVYIGITIDQAGRPTLAPVGFAGTSCLEATASLEALLSDGSEINRTLTNEYYEGKGGKKELEAEHA